MERDFSRAFSYARTSALNGDTDSEPRQRKAINEYAQRAGIAICGHHYDNISGTKDIEVRPAFDRVLKALESSDIGVVIVEDVSRFARESLAGKVGLARLQKLGVRLIGANTGKNYVGGSAADRLLTGIMLEFSEYERAVVIERLQSGRNAVITATGWCGGWKVPAEAVTMARSLRNDPRTPMSLRGIGKRLAAAGYISESGRPFGPSSVKLMVD